VDEAGVTIVGRRRWPRRLGFAVLGLLLLLVVAIAIIWPMRVNLARDYIDDQLARRGVRASYEVKRIGFGSQVLEHLVLGDPANPDLVAEHVEVQIGLGFTGPYVGLITARGVRMKGRIAQGRLLLGEVDKLMGPPTGEPFRLPDQRIDVRDAALTLATPAGELVLAFAGQGNLAGGFRGGLALVAHELDFGACRLTGPIARLSLRIENARPRLHGPAAVARAACGNVVAERALFDLNLLLSEGLDRWRGSAAARIASLGADGQGIAGLEGHLSFEGDAARTAGGLDLAGGAGAAGGIRAEGARFQGRYAGSVRGGELNLSGRLGLSGLTFAGAEGYAAALRGARGSPVEPIAEALAAAVRAAGRGGAEGEADVELAQKADGQGALRFHRLGLAARSGARLGNGGGDGIALRWPSRTLSIDGDFALSGGGFPDIALHLVKPAPGGPVEGLARIAPMAAGGARLALAPVAFSAGPGGRTAFSTRILLDGPLPGGRVTGLELPLSGHLGAGGVTLGETCVAAAFKSLRLQSLALGATRLSLCPAGRAIVADGRIAAELRAPRLAGRLGGTPIALAADRLRLGGEGFAATRLAVRLGPAGRVSRLDSLSLDGRFLPGGMAGRFAGLSGALAGVPLLVGEGSGAWRLRGADLALDGRLVVADAQAPARFHPLAAEDAHLSFAGNRIHATGTLLHPASRTRVASATIDHDLARGAGVAVLDVDALRFTPGFQPEALSPLTVGIVALVNGSVSGRGRIAWDAQGVRSSGSFATADMGFAAPFGPVEGLSTRIDFTDLLGLVSAPGQEARVRVIHTGIDVFDGAVRYQLRPDYHVAVESARWPFAGGSLSLEPTLLDFSRESTKSLTFRVEGLDAARFIQTLEFSNIAATGIYDGTIPMRFDSNGGRVVGGHLLARPGGGTLSYVGELSDRDLGPYGVLAFDALKSLRYSRLEIALDGALAGEFLTRIDMAGIARDAAVPRRAGGGISGMVFSRVLGQLSRIPFHFNIRVQGPFRALLATTRSFQDPSDLIRAALPELADRPTPAEPHVQPPASGHVP
jgi:translocation and assembly module TamB